MALLDVSKMITTRQRLCEFVEWFVRVYQVALSEALTEVFQADLEEGQPVPDVVGLVDSLVRRLRRALTDLIEGEMQLLGSLKDEAFFRGDRDRLTSELRQVFMDARNLFRMAYGFPKSDDAGFPRRMAEEPLALMRQVLFVVRKLTSPDFDLGESQVSDLNATRETILGHFQPKAEELRQAMDDIVRQRSETQGKQAVKDQAMKEFDSTYVLFVRIVEGGFRMAGQDDLAARFRRTATRRSPAGESQGEEPQGEEPQGEESQGEEPQGEEPQGEEPQGEEPQGEEPRHSLSGTRSLTSEMVDFLDAGETEIN